MQVKVKVKRQARRRGGARTQRRAAPSKFSPLGGQRSTRSDKRGGNIFDALDAGDQRLVDRRGNAVFRALANHSAVDVVDLGDRAFLALCRFVWNLTSGTAMD